MLLRAFCLCISPLAFAATRAIEGTVVDPSNRAVPHATVRCAGSIVETGLDGRFRIEGPRRCPALIESAGFEPVRTDLTAGAPRKIVLSLARVKESVVVSALRAPATAQEAGVSADLIVAADLEQRGQPFLRDVLRELPSVHVTSAGRYGASTQIFIRGAQRTGTLVLLDGVPINDPGGDLNAGHLLSGDLDRIEVVRGPQSALFGATAAGGVIQMFTKRGDAEARAPHASLSYERGSFQTDRWLANVNGGWGERLDYSVSSGQFRSSGFYANDSYRLTSGTANVGYRAGAGTQLRAVLRGYDSNVGAPNRVGYAIYDFDARRAARDYTAGVRLEDVRGPRYFQTAFLHYHRLKDTFNDARSDGPYTVAALVRDSLAPVRRVYLIRQVDPAELPVLIVPPGARLVKPGPVRISAFPSVSIAARAAGGYQGTWQPVAGTMVFGYEYERQWGTISSRGVDRNNHGAFAIWQRGFGNRLWMSGGARLERNSAFGTFFTPRVAATWRVAAKTSLRLSAARGFTEPSLLQNFARESTYTGNPALRPEKTASYEAGLARHWWNHRLRTEATIFRSSFRDLIVFTSLGPTSGTFENLDTAWARGLELSAEFRPFKYTAISGAYTRLWTRVVSSSTPFSSSAGIGQELQRRPKNSGSIALSVAPRRWFFQCSAVFTGERQEPQDVFGVTRNPGYTNVAAGVAYTVTRYLSPFLRVENVLNERYSEALGYRNLPRSVRGGLRLTW
jgi:outer membrane cobalamin receptor